MTGAAVRFFVVCFILQHFVLDNIGVPFWLTVPSMVVLIWLYTRKGRHQDIGMDRHLSDTLHVCRASPYYI